VWGASINKRDMPPRPGDVAGAYANADRAHAYLQWHTELPIEKGIEHALAWGRVRDDILQYA
jgi:UDP-glucose 4-epimerase